MKVNVRCPNKDCGQSYAIESSKLGTRATCKRCGKPFELAAETVDSAPTDETRPTPTKSSEPAKPKPQKLGRFEIRQRVGSGAFGDVYRAYDPTLEREVALKIPRSGVVMSEQAKARFLREPKAAAKLQHPHIVPVFETGSVGKHLYIASAFIEGETLDDKIGDTALDFRQAAEIVRDLADALHNAHQKGIVHRDVKSSNVMIDPSGQAMLMDFGLARMEYVEEHLTQEGSVTGTPAYMSPEQAGQGADKAGSPSDQYSLGVVLYELLCGQRPFTGTLMEVMRDILNREPTPPRQINPSVPLDLETICLRAMSKEPERRYEDCRAMADDLGRWLDDKPIAARPIGHPERVTRWCRRNPVLAAVSVTAVALVAVAGFVLSAFFSSSSERDVAQTQRQQAESRLEQAESDLERLKRELAETREELAAAKEALAEATTDEERAAAQARIDSAEKQRAEIQRQTETSAAQLAATDPNEPLTDSAPTAPSTEPATPEPISLALDEKLLRLPGLLPAPLILPGVGIAQLETVLPRNEIVQVDWNPDGHIACATGHEVIRVFDPNDARLLKVYPVGARSLQWSPDGQHLATGEQAKRGNAAIVVWASNGTLHRVLSKHNAGDVAWSPDGKNLVGAVSDYDGAVGDGVRVWSVEDGRQIGSCEPDSRMELGRLAWSPDGEWFAVIPHDPPMDTRIYHPDGTLAVRIPMKNVYRSDLAWSPDSRWIAGCGEDGKLMLWQPDGKPGPAFASVASGVMAWSNDGILANAIYSLTAFDSRQGSDAIWKLPLQNVSPRDVAWSKAGGILALACTDRRVRMVNAAGTPVGQIAGHDTSILSSMHWGGPSGTLRTCSSNGTLCAWGRQNSPNGTVSAILSSKKMKECCWDAKGQWIAIVNAAGETLVQRLDGRPLYQLPSDVPHNRLAYDRNSERFAVSCNKDETLRIHPANGTQSYRIIPNIRSTHHIFSPDGQTIAIHDWDSRLWLWNVASAQGTILDEKCIHLVSFTPDGRHLVYGANRDTVIAALDGRQKTSIAGCSPRCAAVSPDSQSIATADQGTVTIWDIETGEPRTIPDRCRIATLRWTVDDSTLYAGCEDGALRRYDVATGKLEWIGFVLGSGHAVVFTPDGKFVDGDQETIDREFMFVLRKSDGRCEIYNPSEFESKFRHSISAQVD